MTKKLFFLLPIVIIITIYTAKAQPGSGLGFFIGLATPNDQINNVYNDQQWEYATSEQNGLANFFSRGAKTGYTLGAKLRIRMSDNVNLYGGIAWARFPESTVDLIDPDNGNTIATFQITNNIVPVTGGIDLYIIKDFIDIINIYGVGEISYNYISNSVDYQSNSGVSLAYNNNNPADSRLGFGLGAGFDFDLKLVTLNLEAKYNYLNLIGQSGGEEAKDYLSVTTGIFF